MVVTCGFGMLSASQFRSALLVDSVLTVLLSVVQGTAALVLFAIALTEFCQRNRGLNTWPVTLERVAFWADKDKDMIGALLSARHLLDQSASIPMELLPVTTFSALAFQLDKHRQQTKTQQHVLEWTVQDMTEDLTRIVWQASAVTLLPNQLLEVCSLG
jgi:hypothetical protein